MASCPQFHPDEQIFTCSDWYRIGVDNSLDKQVATTSSYVTPGMYSVERVDINKFGVLIQEPPTVKLV